MGDGPREEGRVVSRDLDDLGAGTRRDRPLGVVEHDRFVGADDITRRPLAPRRTLDPLVGQPRRARLQTSGGGGRRIGIEERGGARRIDLEQADTDGRSADTKEGSISTGPPLGGSPVSGASEASRTRRSTAGWLPATVTTAPP
jgi:hypothetical protein